MERLEEIVDRVRGHDRTGVGDGERRAAVCGPGGNFDPTTGLVVFERVVHEVRLKAFVEASMAGDECRSDRWPERHGPVVRLGSSGVDDLAGESGQVERFADASARLSPGQGGLRLAETF